MHALKVTSILILLAGIGLFILGLVLYWTTNPISGWASASIMIGLLFLLGAIIMLAISEQYDLEPLM